MARAVRTALSDSGFVEREQLRLPGYKTGLRPFTGLCYVASEAYFHLTGGFESGLKPKRVKLRHAVDKLPAGTSHWWLVGTDGSLIDLTAEQFECKFPYRAWCRRWIPDVPTVQSRTEDHRQGDGTQSQPRRDTPGWYSFFVTTWMPDPHELWPGEKARTPLKANEVNDANG